MRISPTRIEVAILAIALISLIALAAAPAWWGRTFGQEVSAPTQPNAVTGARTLSDGWKATIEGIVIKRDPDGIVLREADGTETFVVVTSKTEIKTVRKGLFRSDRIYSASQILRGLRVNVDVLGNSDGKVVARRIRFHEQDLHTAQSLESRVDRNKGIDNPSGLPEKAAVVQLTNLP